MKQSLSCKKDSKGQCKFQPVRRRSEEEPKRDLIRFYTDKRYGADYIASFWDEVGNRHMRVCTPKGCEKVGFPFAGSMKSQSEEQFRTLVKKWWTLIETEGKGKKW